MSSEKVNKKAEMARDTKAKNVNRPSRNNNNKVTKDGPNFQNHMLYYVIGLCHEKCQYSARYEGDAQTYGALDDVVLKILDNESSKPVALYLMQAKQHLDENKQISLANLLEHCTKYIDSYKIYRGSSTFREDGPPTQMIYWTCIDLHRTTKQVTDEFVCSGDPFADMDAEPIKKYWIKDWKKLFIYEIASKLKNCAELSGEKVEKTACKIERVAKVLVREAVEEVEEQTESGETKRKLKFRQNFLDAKDLSGYVAVLRNCLDLAYDTIGKKPDCTKLAARSFDDIFGLDFAATSNPDEQCIFEYMELKEDELDWFFKHYIYYTNVPKGEIMLKEIYKMFNACFDEQLFEKYLIKNNHLVEKRFVDSLLEIIKTTTILSKPPITCIEFNEAKKLQTTIEGFLKQKPIDSRPETATLTIVAPTNIDWTVSRVIKEVRKASTMYVVVEDTDIKMLNDALCVIEKNDALCVIDGELQTIIEVDLKKELHLRKGIRKISIIPPTAQNIQGCYFVDQISYSDVNEIYFDKFNEKQFTIDDKEIALNNCCGMEEINDNIETLNALYTLINLEVKSEMFDYNEKCYVKRELLENNTAVDDSTLISGQTQSISIISDVAGQGKTVELLRLASKIMTLKEETIGLYLRAKTIANDIPTDKVNSVNVFQYLPKILHVEPRSSFTEAIVSRCLERYKVILLVDGFDEIGDDSQAVVIKFLKNALGRASCSLIIATRTEAKVKLDSNFKSAKSYTLGKFAYEQYFKKLWLKDRPEPTMETLRNIDDFMENFDRLFKGAGCKLFLEVPQFCRIMGSIYQDRIHKSNFKLHHNYEIGSIYDAFVHSQFSNTFDGYFDEKKLKDAMVIRVLKDDFLTRHMELALYNQYKISIDRTMMFKDLVHYDLVVDQDDQCEFIHITVMEYFLVRYFMTQEWHDDEITSDAFDKFLFRYFCVSRANIADKFIDFFLSGNVLTDSKKELVVMYLECNPKYLPTFIRTTLNNATFNTLKLLLSITPEWMLMELCFRFGSVKQTNKSKQGKDGTVDVSSENEINLKRLGENQVLLLWQALDESNSTKIKQNLLFPADSNEEDIIEVAIRKPFPKVFDKVIEDCTEQYVEEFQRHVRTRAERYAQVIVQHCYAENKERMLDKIVRLCKAKLSGETISDYLQSFDLFKVLVDNIEVETTGKKFIENDRLGMMETILDLLNEYLEPNQLAIVKVQGKQLVLNSVFKFKSIQNRLSLWLD